MKKILIFASAIVLCSACFHINENFNFALSGKEIKGAGPVETRTLDYKDFNGIHIKGGANIHFYQGENYEVSVTAQESIFDSLDYVVKDSVLFIQCVGGRSVKGRYDIDLTVPSLERVEVDGAVDFEAETPWTVAGDLSIIVRGAGELSCDGLACKKLSLSLNGAAEVEAQGLDVSTLAVEVNGAGKVEVDGKAGEADLEVNGAGEVDARDLTVAGDVRKKAAGAAIIRL